jgi:hypothetical protein
MFRNVRVEGDIKIFSYNNRQFLVSISDMHNKKEFKIRDADYLNFLHNNIGLLNPCLFYHTTHQIVVLSDQQITRSQYVSPTFSQIVSERRVIYDPFTENIFNNIQHWERINVHKPNKIEPNSNRHLYAALPENAAPIYELQYNPPIDQSEELKSLGDWTFVLENQCTNYT